MEPGRLAFLLTAIIYAIFYDTRILYIFFSIIGGFTLFHLLTPRFFNTTRRKLMIATWDEPREGNILAKMEFDVTKVNEYIQDCREKLGLKVTLLHFVVRAVASTLKDLPDVNGRIVFGKYIPYDKVNVSCLVDIDGGKDLAVATVEDADKKTIEEIAEYVAERAQKIKSHQDEVHKQQTSLFKLLPSFAIAFATEFLQIVGVDIGLNVPALNIKKFLFGGTMVTNVGPLGVKDAFAPFTPFARVPMLLSLCETTKKPIVRDDKIVIAPMVNLNWTIDHRFLDGGRVKKLITNLENYFADPYAFSKLKKQH